MHSRHLMKDKCEIQERSRTLKSVGLSLNSHSTTLVVGKFTFTEP